MHPSPTAETSRPLLPNVRFFIVFSFHLPEYRTTAYRIRRESTAADPPVRRTARTGGPRLSHNRRYSTWTHSSSCRWSYRTPEKTGAGRPILPDSCL